MKSEDKNILRELDSIKRLLVLLLAKLGSGSDEIAMALDIDPSGVRKMMSMRKVEKLRLLQGN